MTAGESAPTVTLTLPYEEAIEVTSFLSPAPRVSDHQAEYAVAVADLREIRRHVRDRLWRLRGPVPAGDDPQQTRYRQGERWLRSLHVERLLQRLRDLDQGR